MALLVDFSGAGGVGEICIRVVASTDRVVVRGAWHFAGKLLEGLALRLRDEQGGEATAQHEQGEDLHDVRQPRRWVGLGRGALGSERAEDALSNDGTYLARAGGETVRGRPVAGWEAFARHDEGGGVGAEVEEELGEHIERQQAVFADLVVGKSNDDEEDGQNGKAHELNRLATNRVDRGDSHPVAWNGAGADNDQVADSSVAEDVVHIAAAGIANGTENDRVVETQAVEGDIEEEPRARRAEENLAVLPLRVMSPEIGPRCLGCVSRELGDGNEDELTLGDCSRARESCSTAARLTSSGWPSRAPAL